MAANRRDIDWTLQPLGRRPDSELAVRLGCDEATVRRQRQKRGLPRFYPDRDAVAGMVVPPRAVARRVQLNYPDGDNFGEESDVDLSELDGEADTEPAPDTQPSVRGPDIASAAPNARRAPTVRDWATPQQRAALDGLLRYGSIVAAAEALGMTAERLRGHLTEADRRAARAGWSPPHDMTKPVPAGYHVKGVSTLYGADGTVRGQWVKSAAERDTQLAMLLDAVQEIAEPFKGRSEMPPVPQHGSSDLLAVYPIGDAHIGLYAWAAECGENFDLTIAEKNIVDAIDHLVGLAPACDNALIINVGDFFHSDDSSNRTARSGHALDVDSRWAKVLAVGIRAMRRCVDRALEKHRFVRVINAAGNHDFHSSTVLSLCLASYYENNPRVEIDTSPAAFHWYRFGKCLIGVTHGDQVKLHDLPAIMATDRAQDWGETKHRFWMTGHVHHDQTKEMHGCVVETCRTLAAKDAWHTASGYRSGRDMKLHVMHREHGRIVRHEVGVEQLPKVS